MSKSLRYSVPMPAAVAASAADVIVECRANKVRAKLVPLPFYKRPKKTIP